MPLTLKCQRVKYAVHSKTRSPHISNCFVVLLLDCFCFMPVFGELQVYFTPSLSFFLNAIIGLSCNCFFSLGMPEMQVSHICIQS